ncbi:TVP38/TMEM64 family protein [uncultured Megasphaera sp.]|uniref:TVP38/TMEM64 family protein n=1 Tax=uncultured Megasphaera sp. TaxID=165188 RepID=UPI00259654F6|nr:VTT domain-containing protein [uncultured Megasphaera sp.]
MMNTSFFKESHFKLSLFALLGLLLIGIHWHFPHFYETIWHLAITGNIEGTVEYIHSFGVWAVVISSFITIFVTMVGVLPSIFISAANGVIFGLVGGTLISWLSETIGVTISFILMRTLFHGTVKQWITHKHLLFKLDKYSTFSNMLLARAIPYAPNGVVTALGAVSSLSYKEYIAACLIGKLPSVAFEVLVGHDFILFRNHGSRLVVTLLGISICYAIIIYFRRRK